MISLCIGIILVGRNAVNIIIGGSVSDLEATFLSYYTTEYPGASSTLL